jgi:polyhydroxyalkanoate synthesis regulator phasin
MREHDSLKAIEMRCQEIIRSPYSFRELPKELQRLSAVMKSANTLAREDVPNLLAEVKSLRAQVAELQKQVQMADLQKESEEVQAR